MMDKILENIYFDPKHPASFSGAEKLYQAAHAENTDITRKFVKDWLSGQDSYTLNKPAKRKFERSRLISAGLFVQNDVDLYMDVSNLSSSNDKVRFILVSIDTLSRKVYLQPLKTKRGVDVREAFEKIWGDDPWPKLVRSDEGKEFKNSSVQSFFKEHDIHHFTTTTDVKAHLAEHVIRTLRGCLHRLITHRQNERYIDHLQDIAFAYNNSIHSSIGIKPADVNQSNERLIWWTQYMPRSTRRRPFLFEVDDYVRISYARHAFTRGYDYSFSGEIFKVIHRMRRDSIPVYKLNDMADEPVKGTFYTEELNKVAPKDIWKVEKVIRTRKRRGHPKESLVKWLHFPPRFNQWIPTADIIDI